MAWKNNKYEEWFNRNRSAVAEKLTNELKNPEKLKEAFRDPLNIPYDPTNEYVFDSINLITLKLAAQEKGFTDPRWVTFNEAKAAGTFVRAGEKSVKVEFTSPDEANTPYDTVDKKSISWKDYYAMIEKGERKKDNFRFHHNVYDVFNADQLADKSVLPDIIPDEITFLKDIDPEKFRDAIFHSAMPKIYEGAGALKIGADRFEAAVQLITEAITPSVNGMLFHPEMKEVLENGNFELDADSMADIILQASKNKKAITEYAAGKAERTIETIDDYGEIFEVDEEPGVDVPAGLIDPIRDVDEILNQRDEPFYEQADLFTYDLPLRSDLAAKKAEAPAREGSKSLIDSIMNDLPADFAAVKAGNRYLIAHRSFDGGEIDYTIYNADKRLLDGGRMDFNGEWFQEAFKELFTAEVEGSEGYIPSETVELIDYEAFREEADAIEADKLREKIAKNEAAAGIVDEWEDSEQNSYTVWNVPGEDDFYSVEVNANKSNSTMLEYNEKPSHEKVESDYTDYLAEKDFNAYEAEYGADGWRAFGGAAGTISKGVPANESIEEDTEGAVSSVEDASSIGVSGDTSVKNEEPESMRTGNEDLDDIRERFNAFFWSGEGVRDPLSSVEDASSRIQPANGAVIEEEQETETERIDPETGEVLETEHEKEEPVTELNSNEPDMGLFNRLYDFFHGAEGTVSSVEDASTIGVSGNEAVVEEAANDITEIGTGEKLRRSGLNDFGKKIGGARKDLWGIRGLMLDDLAEMNEAETKVYVKKDNIWKKPDYQKMVDSGIPRTIVYAIKCVRDSLKTKPNRFSEEEVKKYVEYVTAVRDEAMACKDWEQMKEVGSFFTRHTEMDLDAWFEDKKFYRECRQLSRGEAYYEREAKRKDFCYSERESILKDVSLMEYDNKFIKVGKEDPNDPENHTVFVSIGGVGKRFFHTQEAEQAILNVKEGQVISCAKGRFLGIYESREAALDAAYEKLKPAEEEKKAEKSSRKKAYKPHRLDAVRQTGAEYKASTDNVKGEDYLKDFGFRGGEFGNWLNDADRQKSLDCGYISFMNIAKALDIEPKDVAMNESLSIAFGARGHGKAAAHYEPMREVINLTKMSGAGSLGHEWIHAQDDILGKALGYGGMLSEYKKTWANQKEAPNCVNELMDCIKRRPMTHEEYVKQQKQIYESKCAEIEKKLDSWLTFNDGVSEEKQKELVGTIMDALKNSDGYQVVSLTPRGGAVYDKELMQEMKDLQPYVTERSFRFISRNTVYLNANWRATLPTLKQEAEKAKTDTNIHYTETDFYKNAKAMDTSFTKDSHGYWASDCELVARAGAAYLKDKLEEKGIIDDYLSGHAEGGAGIVNEAGDIEIVSVAPQGEERKRINEAFDHYFDFIKEQGLFHSVAQERETVETKMVQNGSLEEKLKAAAGKVEGTKTGNTERDPVVAARSV